MKIDTYLASQIKAFGWEQLQHDRYYHKDIYTLNTQDMLKHFTLHQAKYQARIFDIHGNVNYKTLVDMFIIVVATQNTAKSSVVKLWENVKLPAGHIGDRWELLNMVINATAISAKVCEGLDHIEKQDFVGNVQRALSEYMEAIYQLCTWTDEDDLSIQDLLRMCSARLLEVELNHPMFFDLKQQMFQDPEKYFKWYVHNLENPTMCLLNSIIKEEEYFTDISKPKPFNDLMRIPLLKFASMNGYIRVDSKIGKWVLTERGVKYSEQPVRTLDVSY